MAFQPYFDIIYQLYLQQNSEDNYYIDLLSTIDWSIIPEHPNERGRRGYSRLTLLKIFFIASTTKLRTYTEIIDFLKQHPYLSHAIGLDPIRGSLPSTSTLCRFVHSCDLSSLTKLVTNTAKGVLASGIADDDVCIDSHPIKANSSLNNPKNFSKHKPVSDRTARWGVKSKDNSSKLNGFIYYFGYKKHCLSLGSFPLVSIVTPANVSDSTLAIPLLKLLMRRYNIKGKDCLLDKGYDANCIYDFIHEEFDGTAFIPKKRNSRTEPHLGKCGSRLKRHSSYFEKARKRHRVKYTCPLLSKGMKCPFYPIEYGCTSYVTVRSGRYRDFLDRKSEYFKKKYKKRMAIESLFSQIETGRLERVNGYGTKYVRLLSNMADLFMLASALLAIKMGRIELLRSTVKLKRAA